MDAVDGVGADEPGGFAEVHHGQPRGFGEQAADGDADAWADDAAQIFRIGRNGVEGDGGAHVDDDARAAVIMQGRDAVDDAVRAHLPRIVVENLHAGVGFRIDEESGGMEIALGHLGELGVERRDDAAGDDAVNAGQIERGEREQVAQQHAPFVGGLLADGA